MLESKINLNPPCLAQLRHRPLLDNSSRGRVGSFLEETCGYTYGCEVVCV